MTWEKEYSRLVISKIDDLAEEQRELQREVHKISQEMAALRSRAAVWGALAGSIFSAVVGSLFQFFVGVKK